MKYLIIRDDDLSFWTDKDELEEKYLPILENNYFVSFGVIAKSVKSFNLGCHDLFYQDFNQVKSINDNINIVKFIKNEE